MNSLNEARNRLLRALEISHPELLGPLINREADKDELLCAIENLVVELIYHNKEEA